MLVPKNDVGMLAVDDMPMVERVAEGEQAQASLEVISDDFGSIRSCMAQGYSPLPSRAQVAAQPTRKPVSKPPERRVKHGDERSAHPDGPTAPPFRQPDQAQYSGGANADTRAHWTSGPGDAVEGLNRKRFSPRSAWVSSRSYEVMGQSWFITLSSFAADFPYAGNILSYRATRSCPTPDMAHGDARIYARTPLSECHYQLKNGHCT